MSSRKNKRSSNCNLPLNTVADLEKAVVDLESNLTNVDKYLLRKLVMGMESLTKLLEDKQTGVFNIVIKWYRLYLNVQISIDRKNEKLLKLFEKTISTTLSYIIGCLQHKSNEMPNYHYSLLEIIEEILEYMNPNVLKQIVNFETGTIACLWNPIDYAGNFNTQLKSLKVLSLFLKYLDKDRQNDELKSIKWTHLFMFQDKLKSVVQETTLASIFENTARELLNNYNMNLSNKNLVYSFYCKTLTLGKEYEFYKPLNLEKFWIDLNYTPRTVSYNGELKINPKSKYYNVEVNLKIKNIKIEKNKLTIYFMKPGEFSKYSEELSNVDANYLILSIDDEEEERLQENIFVIEYFNNVAKSKTDLNFGNAFDRLKGITHEDPTNKENLRNTDESQPGNNKAKDVFKKSYDILIGSSPKETNPEQRNNPPTNSDTPENNYFINDTNNSINGDDNTIINDQSNLDPLRITDDIIGSPKSSSNNHDNTKRLRNKRKFFSYLLDDDMESEEEIKKSKKKSRAKKPRQPKPPAKKQIGKVTPIVDLTKTNANPNAEIVNLTNILNDGEETAIPTTSLAAPILTSQQCSVILKNVANMYDVVGDNIYVEGGQSYRNFKTQPISVRAPNTIDIQIAKGRRRPNHLHRVKEENKENTKRSVNSKQNINKENSSSDKENISSNVATSMKRNINGKHRHQNNKRILSQNLFETSNDISPTKKQKSTHKGDINKYSRDVDDMTTDENEDIPNQQKQINNMPRNMKKSDSTKYLRDMDDITTDENEDISPNQQIKEISRNEKKLGNRVEIDLISDDNDSDQDQQQPLQKTVTTHNKENFQNNKISTFTTYENILNNNSSDIEEVRSLKNTSPNPIITSTPNMPPLNQSNLTTPRPTSAMNISDLNDSDMELTQLPNQSNFILDKFRKEQLPPKNEDQRVNVVKQILSDWQQDVEEDPESINELENIQPEFNVRTMNEILINDIEINQNCDEDEHEHEHENSKECIVFQKRFDNEDSENSDIDGNEDEDNDDGERIEINPCINFLKGPDNIRVNEDFVAMHNIASHSNPNPINNDLTWNTPDKNSMIVRNVSTKTTTECQLTPNTVIMRQIEISTKEAVIVRDTKQGELCKNIKAKKRLNDMFYENEVVGTNTTSSPPMKKILQDIETSNGVVSLNNNNDLEGNPYLTLNTKDKTNGLSSTCRPMMITKTIQENRTNEVNYMKNVVAKSKRLKIVDVNKTNEISLNSNNSSAPEMAETESLNQNARSFKIIEKINTTTNKPINSLETSDKPIGTNTTNLISKPKCVSNVTVNNGVIIKNFENQNQQHTNIRNSTNSNKPIRMNTANLMSKPKCISNITVNNDIIKINSENQKPVKQIVRPKTASSFVEITLKENTNNYDDITLPNPVDALLENPITYNVPNISHSSNDFEEINTEQRLSQCNNPPVNMENTSDSVNNIKSADYGLNESLENGQEWLENDLSILMNDYNRRIQIKLEAAQRQCLTNMPELYTQKVCEITESVLQRSEEQKKELDLLRSNIERLVTQMEWQYQAFVKKSKQYDNYMDVTERALDGLMELNIQIEISTEYEELLKQFDADSNEVIKEVWKNYLEKKKQDIDNLLNI